MEGLGLLDVWRGVWVVGGGDLVWRNSEGSPDRDVVSHETRFCDGVRFVC